MSDFDTFICSLRNEFGEKEAGKKFEVFCKWFLENDPQWSKTVRKVWLWDDFPNKWQRQDLGTDLVFEDKDGLIWAVQAKCYGEHRTTTKTDMNSFLADSSRQIVHRRLWLQTTNKIEQKAVKTLKDQDKPVTIFKLSDFRSANLDYPSSFAALYKTKPRAKPKPDPHQIEAIDAVVSGLKKSDRGQLIMACGTGKTFTTLWIKEALKANSTLVLLPSLSLLSQTMREWAWGASDEFEILNVCSDSSVGRVPEDMGTSEATFPVTSDVTEIVTFLKRPDKKVLFCTYQSSPLIAEAQEDKAISAFDLAIADEAHRCAGNVDAGFSTILDQQKIRASKRLFTTATPRYFGRAARDAAKLKDTEIVGMDDENVFGPVVHKLTFGEAIQRDLLNDYQVVVVGVDEPRVKLLIDNDELVSSNPDTITDAKTLAAKVGLIKAIKDFDLKRVISFHSRVSGAEEFSEEFIDILKLVRLSERPNGQFYSDYVEGKMNAGERAEKIQRLKTLEGYDRGILSNARCLAEGVDVPSLDGIAFIDPRGSQIEIIQAVGRAIRKVRNAKSQSLGIIVIPVFIREGESPEASIEASDFKPVWDILKALRAHDEVLAETLDNGRASLAKGRRSFRPEIAKLVFDLPASVGVEFADALKTVVIEASTSSWEYGFAKLQQFKEENGTCLVRRGFKTDDGYGLDNWVNAQRFNRGSLSQNRVRRLESIGFVWDPKAQQWEEGYMELQQYKKQSGDCLVPDKFKTEGGYELGIWVGVQRGSKSKGKLSHDRIERLNCIGFVWDPYALQWEQGFEELLKYKDEYGDCLPSDKFITKTGYRLGQWVGVQRTKRNSISPDKKVRLDRIGFVWDAVAFKWKNDFERLLNYKEKYGDCLVPQKFKTEDGFNLGNWVTNKRATKAKLTKEQIKSLDSIGFVWDRVGEHWEKGFAELLNYFEQNGDCLVGNKFVTKNGFKLGVWVGSQRSKQSRLPQSQKARLDNIGFVWDPLAQQWETGFSALLEYKEKYGDCLVPQKFKTEDGFNLGTWVAVQRRKSGVVSDETERLKNIGFVWNKLSYHWEEGFSKLLQYKKVHGDCLVPDKFKTEDGYNLGSWVSVQRGSKSKDKLSQDRIERLNSIGFVWKARG